MLKSQTFNNFKMPTSFKSGRLKFALRPNCHDMVAAKGEPVSHRHALKTHHEPQWPIPDIELN